ncbi:MAG: hypothetical protein FWF84_04330, partial [Kiritimatiellaeota bacterium]|nr:hypothetical protein [Kiritimatiellota bacterium]
MAGNRVVALEGAFGKAVVDVAAPRVVALSLRQGDGGLSGKSLLSAWPSASLPYTVGAYSYCEDMAGVRYESLNSVGHRVVKSTPTELVIEGIELRDRYTEAAPLVVETWRLAVDEKGDLTWEICQRYRRACEVHKSATPGLFFNVRANVAPTGSGQRRYNPAQNPVATVAWARPEMWEKTFYNYFELIPPFYSYESCELHNHAVYSRRNGFARVKLYAGFANDQDLFLKAEGGYLFRRAKYNSHSQWGLLGDVKGERYGGPSEVSIYE